MWLARGLLVLAVILATFEFGGSAAVGRTADSACSSQTGSNYSGDGASLWGSSTCRGAVRPPSGGKANGVGTSSNPPRDDYVMRVCARTGECVDEGVTVQPPPSAKAKPPRREPGKSDVARFLVGTPGVTVEPAAWTVAGAETNFMATSAGARTNSGTLLGQPVTVQFAPVSYHWAYGDGATRDTSAPGASWQASALPPFAATATSHVFAERGRYTVTVTVQFTARYQFAGEGWRPISGTLALTSKPVAVTVKSVRTVLVGHNCADRPSGPGCSP